MLKEFKQFIMKGNVVDLAVGVVIGVAFGSVVTALVKDLITPLISALGGKPDFSALSFTIHNSKFLYGDFINQVVSFVIIAAVVFFFVVKPLNKLQELTSRNKMPQVATDKKCPQCLSDIPKDAKKCKYCTSNV